jgi:hypothetical protein
MVLLVSVGNCYTTISCSGLQQCAQQTFHGSLGCWVLRPEGSLPHEGHRWHVIQHELQSTTNQNWTPKGHIQCSDVAIVIVALYHLEKGRTWLGSDEILQQTNSTSHQNTKYKTALVSLITSYLKLKMLNFSMVTGEYSGKSKVWLKPKNAYISCPQVIFSNYKQCSSYSYNHFSSIKKNLRKRKLCELLNL